MFFQLIGSERHICHKEFINISKEVKTLIISSSNEQGLIIGSKNVGICALFFFQLTINVDLKNVIIRIVNSSRIMPLIVA
jgi:hypothetical protein